MRVVLILSLLGIVAGLVLGVKVTLPVVRGSDTAWTLPTFTDGKGDAGRMVPSPIGALVGEVSSFQQDTDYERAETRRLQTTEVAGSLGVGVERIRERLDSQMEDLEALMRYAGDGEADLAE